MKRQRCIHVLQFVLLSICLVWNLNQTRIPQDARLPEELHTRQRVDSRSSDSGTRKPRPRIAIISSFLAGKQIDINQVQDLDHLVNKACYAKLWGYDYIFNMTYGFDKEVDEEVGGAYWLSYGTWHRVPHIRDRINDYDWILYADTDYIFNDMKTPLESFLKTWQLHGLNPSIIIPKDNDDEFYTFSAFVLFIKNDPFGRAVLDHWMKFGRGLCKNRNLSREKRSYVWEDSDQPGLWYSLTQAHKDLFPKYNITSKPTCNETTGLIDTNTVHEPKLENGAFGPELNVYFKAVNAIIGDDGSDLISVPIDQPIIWSRPKKGSMAGIGYQFKGWVDEELFYRTSDMFFGFHSNKPADKWSDKAKQSLELCKRVHGCYANYTTNGTLQIGCDGVQYTVASL